MYENITYDDILTRMLSRVPATLDKREGSIIYDALAPAAFELKCMYIELDDILNETFADTASREYLIRRAKERGLEPSQATYAVLKAVSTPSTLELNLGERFSLENFNYKIIEKISDGQYKVECETAGTDGNNQFGRLIPINYIDGLENIELTEVLILAEDEEGTEEFRQRYFDSLNAQSFGGNVADYIEKTKALNGVGGVKVYPIWNGGGTVKLVIIDSSYGIPTNTLINDVQSAIDPTGNQGEGQGLAPIGHTVTVDGVTGTTVNISTSITLQSTYTWEDVQDDIQNKIDEYFLELAKDWENESALVVRISQIESRLLDVPGVLDVENTKINDSTSNLVLGADNIPIRGEITNESQETN